METAQNRPLLDTKLAPKTQLHASKWHKTYCRWCGYAIDSGYCDAGFEPPFLQKKRAVATKMGCSP